MARVGARVVSLSGERGGVVAPSGRQGAAMGGVTAAELRCRNSATETLFHGKKAGKLGALYKTAAWKSF